MRFLKTTIAIILCFSVLLHSGIVDLLFGGIQYELKKEALKEFGQYFSNYKVEDVYRNGIYYEKITSFSEEGKEIVEYIKDSKENHFAKKTEDYTKKNSTKQKNLLKTKTLLFCTFCKDFQPIIKNLTETRKLNIILKTKKVVLPFFKIHSPPPELA